MDMRLYFYISLMNCHVPLKESLPQLHLVTSWALVLVSAMSELEVDMVPFARQ